jgi:hypothetical protein
MESKNITTTIDPRLQDKYWRMNNLYQIVDKEGHTVTFRFNKAQEHFFHNRHNRNILLKSRRLGMTTFGIIDAIDNTLFNRNYRSLFLSYDEPSSKQVFDNIAMRAWNSFPLKHLYKVDASNANMLKLDFQDKQQTFSTIEVKSSGRGGQYDHEHISELAKICAKNPGKEMEIFAGTIPAITPNGYIVIESTAEGDNTFSDLFWEAYDRPTNEPLTNKDYKAFFYNWQWDEYEISLAKPFTFEPKDFKQFKDYQEKHNNKCKTNKLLKTITDQQLAYWYGKYVECGRKWNILLENYPTTPEEAFTTSGSKLFDQAKVQEMMDNLDHLNLKTEVKGDLIMYYPPKLNHTYVAGADPSCGVGKDHSAIVVLDTTPNSPVVVATYKNNEIPPDLLAYEIRNIGISYNMAHVAPERNSMGYATLTKLKEIYPVHLIYKEEKYDREDDLTTERLGWYTNVSTKPKMMFDLSTAVNDGTIVIPSKELLHEMRIYGKEGLQNLKADPYATNHFDLLMATAIALQCAKSYQGSSAEIRTYMLKDPTGSNCPPQDPFAAI